MRWRQSRTSPAVKNAEVSDDNEKSFKAMETHQIVVELSRGWPTYPHGR